jgi:aspartyl-tRNA(Asn)/glutamyl-tRNA(Gln) amidotransferase subunit B
MREKRISAEEALSFPVSPKRLAELLALLEKGEISVASAKEVFGQMIGSQTSASDIVARNGLGRLRDSSALEQAIAEVIADSPSQVALYRSGKTQTFGWFVGQVRKKTAGRADPGEVRDALERALAGGTP